MRLEFRSDTYGDSDPIELELSDLLHARFRLHVQIDSYTKVGNPLKRNPFIHCPEFNWEFTGIDLLEQGILRQELGGAYMFVSAERLSANPLPLEVSGSFLLQPQPTAHGFLPVYLFARQVDDSKAWTSPLFITFENIAS